LQVGYNETYKSIIDLGRTI